MNNIILRLQIRQLKEGYQFSITDEEFGELVKGHTYHTRAMPSGVHAYCKRCETPHSEIVPVAFMQFCSDCVLQFGGKVFRRTVLTEELAYDAIKAQEQPGE